MLKITNERLIRAIKYSQRRGHISPLLNKMLVELVTRMSNLPQYRQFAEHHVEMRAYALSVLARTALRFKLDKSDNPFAFYVTCITGSFISYTAMQKKLRAKLFG